MPTLGKYQLHEELGRGGFATVYRATHLKLNAPRALKILRRDVPGLGSTEYNNFRNRFELEAQLGARLDHPNIVRVYDFEQDGETLILVMEYAPGGILAERIAHAREVGELLSIEELVGIAQDIAAGLAAIHALDAVHRDLKPSNILFDERGRAKVADLGLVQIPGGPSLRSRFSEAVPHPGTPGNMSPEQQSQRDYLAPNTDVYALGLILFEMCTGRFYRNVPPGTRVSTFRKEVPLWLDDLIARMLATDPAQRPWDGAEVLERLMAEGDERSRAVSLHLPQNIRGWVTTWRYFVGGALLLTLLIAGTTSGLRLLLSSTALTATPTLNLHAVIDLERTGTPRVKTLLLTTLTPTPTYVQPTRSPTLTNTPLPPTPTLTSTPEPMPRVYDFFACLEPCVSDGSNSRRYFPERTTKIYLRWRFENFFVGSLPYKMIRKGVGHRVSLGGSNTKGAARMTDRYKVYTKVLKALRQMVSISRQGHLVTLAMMISGIVMGKNAQLSAISAEVPVRVKEKSVEMRLRRWVKHSSIEVEAIYMPFAQQILMALAAIGPLVLVMDGSQVGRRCMVLMVGVLYKRRALPIVWVVYRGEKGHTTAQRHIEALEKVLPLLPPDCEVVLLGDAEYDTVEMLLWLQEHTSWYYVLRTSPQIHVVEGQESRAIDSYLLEKGQVFHREQVGFTRMAKIFVNLVGWWGSRYEEPIYLITNLTNPYQACRYYRRRYRIETFFSDQKSRGFHLHKSHLSDPARLSRLLVASCLAYIWMICQGLWVIATQKTGLIDRTDRRDKSIFRLGLDWLRYALLRGLDIEPMFRFQPLDMLSPQNVR